jgi:hypothetical protein
MIMNDDCIKSLCFFLIIKVNFSLIKEPDFERVRTGLKDVEFIIVFVGFKSTNFS